MLLVFIIANALILLGYVILALCVMFFNRKAPGAGLFISGASAFFLFCGATHAHQVVHAMNNDPITREDWTSLHMLLIHVPQAASIFMAIWGLWSVQTWLRRVVAQNTKYRKFIKDYHPEAADILDT